MGMKRIAVLISLYLAGSFHAPAAIIIPQEGHSVDREISIRYRLYKDHKESALHIKDERLWMNDNKVHAVVLAGEDDIKFRTVLRLLCNEAIANSRNNEDSFVRIDIVDHGAEFSCRENGLVKKERGLIFKLVALYHDLVKRQKTSRSSK